MDLEETLSALRGFVGARVSVWLVPIRPDGLAIPRTWQEYVGMLSLGPQALDPDDPDYGESLDSDWRKAFGLASREGGTIIVLRDVTSGEVISVVDVTPQSFRAPEWAEVDGQRSLVIDLGHHTVTLSPGDC